MNLYCESRGGVAVAPHGQAAAAAARVLAEGGNALEACVTMAATLAAVYPHMTGLGGDGFWVVHHPDAPVQTILGCGRSGGGVTREGYRAAGHDAIPYRGGDAALTVAGTVSGWQQALQISSDQWGGSMPLSRLLRDAIDFCRDGYEVTASQARATVGKLSQLAGLPGFDEVFLRDGAAPAAGSRLTQPALAATLEHLARAGLDDFYRGELAGRIAEDLQRCGSPLTPEDLAGQLPAVQPPVTLDVPGARLFTTPAPTQGAATLMILGLFGQRPEGVAVHEDVDTVHWIVEATKQAFAVRNRELRDPALMSCTTQDLLDPERLEKMAQAIDGRQAADWNVARGAADTTWFGAIDAQGRAVSCIQSLYHEFGSGIVLPQTGLCWQNRGASFSLEQGHPLELRGHTLPFHTLCPSLAHFEDGRTLIFGTMGGDGQPQTQATVFTRYAEYGQPLDQVISAPRWILGRTWGDPSDHLKMESRFAPEWIETLRSRGHEITMLADFDETVGHAGAVVRHPDGRMEGAADPRGDGAACGVGSEAQQ